MDEVAVTPSTEGGAVLTLGALDVTRDDWYRRKFRPLIFKWEPELCPTLGRLVLLFYNTGQADLLLIYWFGCIKLLEK